MATTKTRYTPSVNIIRDSNYLINYIPTHNAELTFNSILNDVLIGVKSYVIIGAFGTGKSSFLLALRQTLEKSKFHFKGYQKLQGSIPDYEFISIVGEFTSIEDYFAKQFLLGKGYTTSDVINCLDKYYKNLKKKGNGLAILIDEFGKFLEFAAKNNPEYELYFIQQLAEWVNDSKNDTLLITTLHQDFSAYSLQLNRVQRQEWDKVKGRLKEVPFNEPVEQLLYLASKRIEEKFSNKILDKNFDTLFETIRDAKAFPLRDYFEKEFARRLYPFEILSAAILTLALQKYGQNERSLFSFIESNDYLGINEFDYRCNPYYSLPQVYDYLLNNYYSFLTSKYNPHYVQWTAVRRALEKIEGIFEDASAQKDAGNILKVIGLLNIFSTASARLEPRFYSDYAKYALGIKNPDDLLKHLEKKKIIRYVKHSLRYVLFEGTDLDIELAIDDAGRLVEKVTNVVNYLNQYFEFPFIPARAVYYEKGTPRFFQFKLTEEPISLIPESEVDGFINLIFSDETNINKRVKEFSASCEEAILYGCYRNTAEIRNLLFEIQKVKKVIENNPDDKVALNLLREELEIKVKLLNHYVLDNLYADNGNIVWYFKGKELRINSRQKLNQVLSRICDEVYPFTPVYKSELINKTKVSGQIALARNKLIKKLLEDVNKPNLGFSDNEFPPEKSIYLTLLRKTGVHRAVNGIGILDKPTDKTFAKLWEAGEKFLESTRTKERSLVDFIQILSSRPFKLKQGFIDLWVPIFLLIKHDEFALYENDAFIHDLSGDIFDLINKKPGLFKIKAFDVTGIKLQLFNRYRLMLNQAENKQPNSKAFIQTIKPFISFYKQLPEYSKYTNRLSKTSIALRQVITKAKDPEKTFFEDFPAVFGYSLVELHHKPELADNFITKLQNSIRELRTAFDQLVDRFEGYLVKEIIGTDLGFPAYRDIIRRRFEALKGHLLLAHQKPFLARLQSELDDRKAWLSSIAQACIGKPLINITDEEELILFDRLRDIIYELDNLCEVGASTVDEQNEEILKLEITSLMKGLNRSLLRVSKIKSREIENKKQEIRKLLGKDKKTNITILTKLLQEYLSE